MYTLKQAKITALQLIDEFSNNANLTDDDDIKLKLNNIFNIAQIEACQIQKIRKEYSIVHNVPRNEISESVAPDTIITHNKDDVIFKAKGGAYHFQVNNIARIVISQQGMTNIVLDNTSKEGFTTYKGFTTGTGEITLRFTGNSFYSIRNVAIWDIKFASYDDIPNYERYIAYDLPVDFYQLGRVETKGIDFANYRLVNKKIVISAYEVGEYLVKYNAYPKMIDQDTDDETYEFDVDLSVAMCLPYYVAGDVLKSDASSDYTSFEAKYYNKLDLVRGNVQAGTIEINQIIGDL